MTEPSETSAYSTLVIVLDTIATAQEIFDAKLTEAASELNFDYSTPYMSVGRHLIFDQPLGGLDWTIETMVTHDSKYSTDFRFELAVDLNTREVEVSGTVDYAGTYGAELLRRHEQKIEQLDQLKPCVCEAIEILFSQVKADLTESCKLSDAAPRKSDIAANAASENDLKDPQNRN